MLRALIKFSLTAIAVLACAGGLYVYQTRNSTAQLLVQEKEKTAKLQQVVKRLGADRRVADVLVTDRKTIDGSPETSLLFVEYDRSGNALSPKAFTVRGERIYFDALVIKFNQSYVADGDALRGHSLALFQRIYGDQQSPSQAPTIDEPGTIPEIYRGSDPRIAEFELELWQQFWRLFSDKEFRESKGVETGFGQSVYGPLKQNTLYTITLESNGGMSMKEQPVPGIYKAALNRDGGSTPTTQKN